MEVFVQLIPVTGVGLTFSGRKLFEDVRNSFLRHLQLAGQFRQLNAFIAKGVEDCSKAFCLNREVRVLQQPRGDSGHAGAVVISDRDSSRFSFEKIV